MRNTEDGTAGKLLDKNLEFRVFIIYRRKGVRVCSGVLCVLPGFVLVFPLAMHCLQQREEAQ
jgi:hypothetical protein